MVRFRWRPEVNLSPPASDLAVSQNEVPLELAPGTTARLVVGSPAPHQVFWFVDSVSIGLSPSHRCHASLLERTTGSSSVSGDELRFAEESEALVSGFLAVPEVNGNWADWRHVLQASELLSGKLVLGTGESFLLEPMDTRVFDPAGSAMICALGGVKPSGITARYEVAPGFGMLVARDVYSGWYLQNPVSRLCQNEDELPDDVATDPSDRSSISPSLVTRLLSVICEDTMDDLYRGDEGLRLKLESLAREASTAAQTVATRAIRAKVDELLDWWFHPRDEDPDPE